MKKLFKWLGVGLAVIAGGIAVFLGVAAMRPAHFSVERSATIQAQPEVVHGYVNDLRKFQTWSPWAKMDPTMKSSFSGPASGPGQEYHWVGNGQVGEGSMKITESKPGQLVRMKLDFIKPFQASNDVDFEFKPAAGGTQVRWVMSGENGLMGKAMCMVMNMDKMVGGDFEKGLASLKSKAEKKS